jgi:Flp pilus assembly protein CpaB
MVSPDEAQKLTLAASEGRIQLALRNPMDGEVKRPPVLRNGELYQSGLPLVVAPKVTPRPKVAAVAPPPPAPYVVEMIRGEKRDSAKF